MTAAEIGRRMDDLGLWAELEPYHWALKPHGTALPYFCVIINGGEGPVKARVLLLEGWQTFQDFVHTRLDHDFGFYTSPMEFPHYELIVLTNGDAPVLFRHDAGYEPIPPSEAGVKVCERMLWEVFGVMMRMETDRKLAMKYASEGAVFARVEGADGTWRDEPMPIPPARPHVERISFPKTDLVRAKDLPFMQDEAIELDFRLIPGIGTKDKRPRCIYIFVALNATNAEVVFAQSLTIGPDLNLQELWEAVPRQVLKELLRIGRVPGEIKLPNQRMFRLMRPLCMHLPVKLSLHDSLPHLEAEFANIINHGKRKVQE